MKIAGVIEAVGDDCVGLESRGSSRRRMAWWKLFSMRAVPARRFRQLHILQIPGISYDGGYAAHVDCASRGARAYPRTCCRPEEVAPLM